MLRTKLKRTNPYNQSWSVAWSNISSHSYSYHLFVISLPLSFPSRIILHTCPCSFYTLRRTKTKSIHLSFAILLHLSFEISLASYTDLIISIPSASNLALDLLAALAICIISFASASALPFAISKASFLALVLLETLFLSAFPHYLGFRYCPLYFFSHIIFGPWP